MKINGQGPYIVFEGVIGVGKTTLARLLHPRFGGHIQLEAFDENPFLSDFYGDRERYAFQTQIFFLLSRYRQQQAIPALLEQDAVLADYCFEKDKLFAHLNITGADELEMYDRLYAALSEKVRRPDLMVYLRAEVDTLMARIAMRDRPYERRMDRAYITALRQSYESLFANYTTTPLYVIETDDVDFVRHPADLDAIEQRIRAALAGVRQPTLPDIAMLSPEWVCTPVTQNAQASGTAPCEQLADWQALAHYLTLTQAVGNIGGALAQSPEALEISERLQTALSDAANALNALAQYTLTDNLT